MMRKLLEIFLGTRAANGMTSVYRLSQLWYLLPVIVMGGLSYSYYQDLTWEEILSHAGAYISSDVELKPAIGYDDLGKGFSVKNHINQKASLLNAIKICRLKSEHPETCRAIPAKLRLFYSFVLRTGGGYGSAVFLGESASQKVSVLKAQRKCNKSKFETEMVTDDCHQLGGLIVIQ